MEIRDSVVVITGGSSGIGRSTAQLLAEGGAKLVLAARNLKALRQAAKECERTGGQAIAFECDVRDEKQVNKLARRAVDEFGRIDVWINNAGVGLYGRFEDVPSDVWRTTVETHLFGVANGARAALRQFRAQGDQGVLIDVSSQVATGGIAYMTAYGAAKYAIRLFDDTLRQELQDSPNIHVTTILPASTDTPFFEKSANYTGRALQPVGSISPPEDVAEAIADVIRNPRRQVLISKQGYAMSAAHALMPNLFNKIVRRKADQDHFQDQRAKPTKGNVFAPGGPEQLYGGWRERQSGSVFPVLAAVAGMAAFGVLLARRKQHDKWREEMGWVA